jgi:hypothetical protein
MVTKPETLEYAKYVILLTTSSSGAIANVLNCHRMTWQIEPGVNGCGNAADIARQSVF